MNYDRQILKKRRDHTISMLESAKKILELDLSILKNGLNHAVSMDEKSILEDEISYYEQSELDINQAIKKLNK